MTGVRRWLKKVPAGGGYAVVDTRKHYAQDGLFTLHNDSFGRDPAFRAAYARGVVASHGLDPQFEWRVHTALATLRVEKVAFLHIDMNCARPERAALEFFWPLLPPGGIVLLDDYAYAGHECRAAEIDRAAQTLGVQVLALPTGQGLIVKV